MSKKSTPNLTVKHFIDLDKINAKESRRIIDLARKLKKEKNLNNQAKLLAGKNLAMIFDFGKWASGWYTIILLFLLI